MRSAQPAYNNSQTVAVGSVLNLTNIIPFANYTLCVRAVNCGGLGPQKCITLIAPEAGKFSYCEFIVLAELCNSVMYAVA